MIIRQSYRPLHQPGITAEDDFLARFQAGDLTADQLLAVYAARVYRLSGSYEEAARRMGLDRRTVKAKVETYLSNATLSDTVRVKPASVKPTLIKPSESPGEN